MGIFWFLNIFILLVELIILAAILVLYVPAYRKVRARSLIGILAFSSLFLVQSAVSLFVYYNLSTKFGENLAVLLLGINTVGLVAFISLFLSLEQ